MAPVHARFARFEVISRMDSDSPAKDASRVPIDSRQPITEILVRKGITRNAPEGQDRYDYRVSARMRTGPSTWPTSFIGATTTTAPESGTRSRLATFSR